MSKDAAPLPDDVALCHQIIRQLQQRVQELEREVAELKTVQAGIIAVDLCLGRRDRANEQRRRARVASCGTVAQEQRRNRQRSGQPIRRADAQRRGHRSVAESQRVGATDRLLSGAARWLRCSFFAAHRGHLQR